MPTLTIPGAQEQAKTQLEIPWLDYASTEIPTNHELILWWAMYLWNSDGNYRAAFRRVVEHFITAVEFPDLEAEEESEFKDLFTQHLNYRRELSAIGYDFICFGNVFLSIYLPFKRNLACAECLFEQPIRHVDYDIQLDSTHGVRWQRKRPCPACGDTTDYALRDRKDPDISRVRLIRYSPFEIELAQNPFSQRKAIWWRIPNDFKQDIRSKARIFVEDTPLEVLEAVAYNGRLLFDEDMILHLDEPTVSGMKTKGWGMPHSIANFRSAWLAQITNRADQAIAADYTLGLRLLSPAQTGQTDTLLNHGMENFTQGIGRIIQNHRAEPMSYHSAPYPVNYQFLGGEGKDLLPPDKLKFRHQEFLNQCNVPLEYHQMSMTVQAAPMGLRLFESAWQAVPSLYTTALQWIVRVTARNFGLPETTVRIQRSTIADDQERKNILMQLMAANQVSPQTALEPLGVDASHEARQSFKHQGFVSKLQREEEEDMLKEQEMGAMSAMTAQQQPSMMLEEQMMQQQQQGGGPVGANPALMGGVPAGGIPGMSGQVGGSLTEMQQQAEAIAMQLVQMPEYDRRQQLKALREGNRDLHSLVKAKMEEIRSSAASQGQQMLLAPQMGGPPMGAM